MSEGRLLYRRIVYHKIGHLAGKARTMGDHTLSKNRPSRPADVEIIIKEYTTGSSVDETSLDGAGGVA